MRRSVMTEQGDVGVPRPDEDVEGHELSIDESAPSAAEDDDSDDVEGHRFY